MFNILRIMLQILTFQRVDEVGADGKPKPWFVTRRFWGLISAAIVAIAAYNYGGEIVNKEEITEGVFLVVSGVWALYQTYVGFKDRKRIEK